MNTLTHFQRNLDAELRERAALPPSEPALSPARRTRPTRRILLAAGTAAAAVAVAVAVPLSTGDGTNPAFAVTRHSDGTVSVQLFDTKAIGTFQAALRKLGIPAVAMVATPECSTKLPVTPELHEVVLGPEHTYPERMLIRPSRIPRGETLLFAVSASPVYVNTGHGNVLSGQSGGGVFQFRLVQKVPSCVSAVQSFTIVQEPASPASK